MQDLPPPYTALSRVNVQVDASQLRCPLPLLKLRQAMRELMIGEIIELRATDRGSINDIAAFARLAGHELLGFEESDGLLYYWLRKLV